MGRAEASGISLTTYDASLVKGMLNRGDRQHDIAAWFGVNGGRIAEIATGGRFGYIKVASTESLPPQGPYPKASQAVEAIEALVNVKRALAVAEQKLSALR